MLMTVEFHSKKIYATAQRNSHHRTICDSKKPFSSPRYLSLPLLRRAPHTLGEMSACLCVPLRPGVRLRQPKLTRQIRLFGRMLGKDASCFLATSCERFFLAHVRASSLLLGLRLNLPLPPCVRSGKLLARSEPAPLIWDVETTRPSPGRAVAFVCEG